MSGTLDFAAAGQATQPLIAKLWWTGGIVCMGSSGYKNKKLFLTRYPLGTLHRQNRQKCPFPGLFLKEIYLYTLKLAARGYSL